jgi:multiple sugar transport system substrate-binding protein
MVVDHPGLGTATATGALLAWEDVVNAGELARWRDSAVGASGASYVLGGRTWALPIDAAAQVALYRPDLVDGVPDRWEDVPGYAADHPVALCLGGPHALLALLALCSTTQAPDGELLDPGAAVAAVDLLRKAWAVADREVSLLNPIGVHEALATGGGPVWCPLAYGYVSYARPDEGVALAFADAPGWRGGSPLSVLGGTGLAVSARAYGDPAVEQWTRAFLTDDVQTALVTAAGGQPAHGDVWRSGSVDDHWGGFYSSTARTLEHAWVRPRVPGWIDLQDEGSSVVRDCVTGAGDPHAAVGHLNRAYRDLAVSLGG